MTTSSYLIAWAIYLLAASGICFIAWQLSSHWRTDVKYVSRISLVVLLFTPYFSDPEQNKLAPAILITLFELIFGDAHAGLKSGTPLILLLIAGVVLAYLYSLTQRKTK